MFRNSNKILFKNNFLFLFAFLTLSFLFLDIPDVSATTQASFTWDPNPEPDVAGYRIFSHEINQHYDYTNPSWEGTDTYCTIYDLDESKAYCFVARAFDTEGFESEDSVEVCLEQADLPNQPPVENEPPYANAGEDQTVGEGIVVTLDGASSLDIDDGIVSYEWTQIGNPAVTLSDPATQTPTFLAPQVGPDGVSLTFNLTVTDTGGLQNTDSCIVNVSWQNESPTAIISPDYLETTQETLVTLDGSASTDSDDGIASYLWTQIEGDPVSLSTTTSAVTTFTAPKTEAFDKNIKLKLTVTDHGGLKGTADSSIYVMQYEPPTLNSVTISGPVQVDESSGAQYILTANYSDGNSSEVTGLANWSDNSSYANISNNGYLAAISVASDQLCTITSNYEGMSDTHNVTIDDVLSNNSPVVDFSYATKRKKVAFNDRSIDSDGTIVSWLWDFGDGTYNITQNPEHRYIKFGNYSVTLTVTDNEGISNSISKSLSISK